MSFQNYRLFSPKEVAEILERYPAKMIPLPSSMQVGERAKYWVWDQDDYKDVPHAIPCLILRVEFGTLMPGCGIRYSLAFEMANGHGWWMVLDDVRDNVTPDHVDQLHRNEDREPPTFESLDKDTDLQAILRRGSFELITGGKATPE